MYIQKNIQVKYLILIKIFECSNTTNKILGNKIKLKEDFTLFEW